MVVAAAGIALAIDFVSRGIPPRALPATLAIGASAARTLLATIAGATITTVGVVFSIVVVSVQLASAQFSPRIVRSFFDDARSKLTVGTLAATFTYSVLALFSLGRSTRQDVPLIAVGLDVVFGLASILSIVSFLNHSARRLYVGNLAERVMTETVRLIDRQQFDSCTDGRAEDLEPGGEATTVTAGASGWLQQVSVASIAELLPPGSTLCLETRVGAYVVRDTVIARVWPALGNPAPVIAETRRSFVLGAERTMQQDIDFGLRQLSDIALRALSPSINDPHTAIEIVLRHGAILEQLLRTTLPPRCFRSANAQVLRPHELDHADYINHAFDDIRQVATDQPSVARAVIVTCTAIAEAAARARRTAAADAAKRQARLMLAGVEAGDVLAEDAAELRRLVPT